jgi:hypothetical protein
MILSLLRYRLKEEVFDLTSWNSCEAMEFVLQREVVFWFRILSKIREGLLPLMNDRGMVQSSELMPTYTSLSKS